MMNHLKASHFILGKDSSTFDYKASIKVGKFAQTARTGESPSWATMKTHFNVGVDSENKTSDYAMRFQEREEGLPINRFNNKDNVKNKTKIELDSTILGIPGALIAESTTTAENTANKHEAAKKVNSPLPSFMANNIRATHFVIGPGGQARPTETHDVFSPKDSSSAKF